MSDLLGGCDGLDASSFDNEGMDGDARQGAVAVDSEEEPVDGPSLQQEEASDLDAEQGHAVTMTGFMAAHAHTHAHAHAVDGTIAVLQGQAAVAVVVPHEV